MFEFKFDPSRYDEQLAYKTEQLKNLFTAHYSGDIHIHRSPTTHYRMRAEFKIWHDGDDVYPVMFNQQTRQPEKITSFPIAAQCIDSIVQQLPEKLQTNPILKHKLFQIELLASQKNEVVLTMIYHKRLDESWEQAAQALSQTLNCHIVGRSRKQKVVISQDFISESFDVNGQILTYRQVEGTFTQPNASMNQAMLNWVATTCAKTSGDALELYCGNGNFTVALCQQFDRVFATEIVKSAVDTANHNLEQNGCSNGYVARLSSEEFTQAMLGVREFRRLREIDLASYEFESILVDPPRSGLDSKTCELIAQFPTILYISCNPQTLLENLEQLSTTHTVEDFSAFDQFPYTHHIECAMKLVKK